ncbi:hypothetical protein [Flexithrix dorotheae]|uniref:hypothetical protein n=1 Tax=Flexithrix dorotheae TaxID=70993 RepID=UPI0003632B31|nr:hypothetical protein [Flexithrix dorotheae]
MQGFSKFFGWIDDPIEFKKMRQKENYNDLSFYKKINGSGKGKISLLHSIFEQATSRKFPVWQQEIGDCVSFGYALGVSTLMGVQIAQSSEEIYPADVASEPIYGGSRIEIGQGRLGCSIDDSTDGSYGVWAAKWVKDYGILEMFWCNCLILNSCYLWDKK